MQAYSDPKRARDPHALPDVEVFEHDRAEHARGQCWRDEPDGECSGVGWYWWTCFPGCLPDSEPMGPFETEAEALADAQDGCED